MCSAAGSDLHPDRARLPAGVHPDQPDGHAEQAAGSRAQHPRHRGELHLLHSGERLHRHAGGRAVRDRVHRRRDGAAFRAHRGEGRRPQLLPGDAADLRCSGARHRAGVRRRRDGPRRHGARAQLQKAKPPRSTSSRYNFVYRGDAGWIYTVRSLEVGSRQLKRLHARTPGQRGQLSRPDHHRGQRELRAPGPGGSGTGRAG